MAIQRQTRSKALPKGQANTKITPSPRLSDVEGDQSPRDPQSCFEEKRLDNRPSGGGRAETINTGPLKEVWTPQPHRPAS